MPLKPATTLAVSALLLAVSGLGWMAWQTQQQEPSETAAEIRAIVAAEGVWDNRWNRHAEKAAALGQELATTRQPGARIELRRQRAEQYLLAGSAEAAAAELQELLREPALPQAYQIALREQLALTWWRLGEQQNCFDNPSVDRCLFPLVGEGLHQRRLGADRAYALLLDLLTEPSAEAAQKARWRWLLNVAAMALGVHPEGVPEGWRIGLERFASEANIGRFRDVAEQADAAVFGLSGGAIIEDFDGDGLLDLMSSSWGLQDPLLLLRNVGGMAFRDISAEAGLAHITGGLNLVHADYDNDGDADVLVLRGAWLHERGRHPNTLLRNDGGRFVDVTHSAGVYSRNPTQTAVWADFDNDGHLDLFVGNEVVREAVNWGADAQPFELYRNTGDGRFEEVSSRSGIHAQGMIKGTAAGDFDDDGWVDLYLSIWGQPNQLYRNLGAQGQPLQFADVTESAGVAEPVASFPTFFWDYDNDGRLDLFVAGYSADIGAIGQDYAGEPAQAERSRLYRNLGNGRFADLAEQLNLGAVMLPMGLNHGDFDNDGWPDLLLGTGAPALETLTPNRAWRNVEGQGFADITTSAGLGHLQKGHGVAFGDLDEDGDQDIYMNVGGAYAADGFWNALYENPGHGHRWISLELEGRQSNRAGVGSRIRIELSDGRHIHTLVGTGGSFGGSSLRQEMGLGPAEAITALEVRWAGSGTLSRLSGPISLDRRYRLIEGEDQLRLP